MSSFKNKGKILVQTATQNHKGHPFGKILDFCPKRGKNNFLSENEINLYSFLKDAVPIIDAAITKIIRLVGSFSVETPNKFMQKEINDFLFNIKINSFGCGINDFIFSYLNQLLTYGTAIGEIVINPETNGIFGIYNASLRDVYLINNPKCIDVMICTKKSGKFIPVTHPELILISTLNPEPGQIYGNSIMKGLPYVSSILLNIFQSISNNWERVGNTRFAVTYKPPQDSFGTGFTQDRAAQIAQEWSRAMSSSFPSDFIAVGDINIKVIGADNQILDSQVPVRQLLEQIVSKLSIPPFLLGLSWSTTETMSEQQTDILTSELNSYRQILNPIIKKICNIYLNSKNVSSMKNIKIIWDYTSVKDKLRIAQAEILNSKIK